MRDGGCVDRAADTGGEGVVEVAVVGMYGFEQGERNSKKFSDVNQLLVDFV